MLKFAQRRNHARCVRHLSVETVQNTVEPLVHLLESARSFTHLSWPVFIPVATTAVRLALTTPLAISNRRRLNKQRELAPLLSASVPVIKAQLASQVVAGKAALTPEQITVLAAKERRKRRVALYREFNCQNWKMLLLPAVQIPVFVAMSFAVRALVGFDLTAVTEFGNADTSQFWWFRNIVEPDPMGIMPLVLGASSFANVELNARTVASTNSNTTNPNQTQPPRNATALISNISRAGSLVFTAFSFYAPLALQLYWVSSNVFSLVQNALLMPHTAMTYPKYTHQVPAVPEAPKGTNEKSEAQFAKDSQDEKN